MGYLQHKFLIYLFAVNGIAYAVMWIDKILSKKKGMRVSEKKLFLLAILCGATGIFFGMKYPIYHKANKPLFKWGIPVLIGLNMVIIYLYVKWML